MAVNADIEQNGRMAGVRVLFSRFGHKDNILPNGPRIWCAAGLPGPTRATRRLEQGLLHQLSTWPEVTISFIVAQPRRLMRLLCYAPSTIAKSGEQVSDALYCSRWYGARLSTYRRSEQ